MSRIGKQPVKLPSGVKAAVEGRLVSVEGPKGKLQYRAGEGVSIAINDGVLSVTMHNTTDRRKLVRYRANYGTTRARINNMVLGVTQGWKRTLELSGVGYTASLKGQQLVIAAGYSHEVKLDIPKSIKVTVNKTVVDLEGPDVDALGILAASMRKVRKPEPYLGKGIKYAEETIRRKAGKTGKK